MNLIEKIKELQGEQSQEEFASFLGVDQSIISRLYSGEITLGRKMARCLCAKFPELRDDVAAFLLDSDMHISNGTAA